MLFGGVVFLRGLFACEPWEDEWVAMVTASEHRIQSKQKMIPQTEEL